MKKILLVSTMFMLVVTAAVAQATQQPVPKIKKIAVTGSAEMEVEPDEIYVNFELREYYNKQKVKVDISVIKKEFLDQCAKAGISKEDIRVEGMGGSAYDYWYRKRKKTEPDFLATVNYIIKFTNAAKIDELVPMLNDEATSNMYVSKISNTKIEDFRKQVKVKATLAAKQKAQYLAESIGERIGAALLIEEIETAPPVYYNKMAMSNTLMEASGEGGDSTTPFQKIKLRYEIRAEFELQ